MIGVWLRPLSSFVTIVANGAHKLFPVLAKKSGDMGSVVLLLTAMFCSLPE